MSTFFMMVGAVFVAEVAKNLFGYWYVRYFTRYFMKRMFAEQAKKAAQAAKVKALQGNAWNGHRGESEWLACGDCQKVARDESDAATRVMSE